MKPTKKQITELYTNQKLTAKQTAENLGCSKDWILKCMKEYDIVPRPKGRGLANKEVAPPTAEQLYEMIHIQQMTFQAVADKYRCDYSSVKHWLKKNGLVVPDVVSQERKRRNIVKPDLTKLRKAYEAGMSIAQLKFTFGANETLLSKWLKEAGAKVNNPGFKKGQRLICKDGHEVLSLYEQRVDNWLSKHKIPHIVEPKLPFNKRFRGDFFANGFYIEVWGVKGSAVYEKRKAYKRQQYQRAGLKLIEIDTHHFDMNRAKNFETILSTYLLE